ncbi:LOG family protein [Lutibacter sp.]
MKKIAVFCGASLGFNEIYKNDAIKLGAYFAKQNIGLVYGGGKMGMMGVLADAILKEKGEVIGVIPGLLRHEEVIHSEISEMIVTKTMSKRKVKISKLVDGYIALPGGFGTLDEIFEALTLSQLGIEQKPVGILNTNGFFNHLIKQLDVMVTEGYLKQSNSDMLIVCDSVEELITKMLHYKAPKITEVTSKVVR